MGKNKPRWKKILWGTLITLMLVLIGEIIILALDSRTPSFKSPVSHISQLIPMNSSKVILFNNLQSETKDLLSHSLIKRFTKLKMTRDLLESNDSKKWFEGIKAFEKYSGLKVDLDMIFRFFGEEGAIVKVQKDILVIAKVDRLTLFLKQMAKTLSKYKLLKKDIITKSYQNILIEQLSFGKQKLFFTFIGSYAFTSNNDKHLKNIIQLANGKDYSAISAKPAFQKAMYEKANKKYPVMIYEKLSHSMESGKKGKSHRLSRLFKEEYWKIALKRKLIKIDYQYYYSKSGRDYPLSHITAKKSQDNHLVKSFPKATAFYLTSSQLDIEKLYGWVLKSWLRNDSERSTLQSTFKKIESAYRVQIRKLLNKYFGHEVAIVLTGIGYQGFNPFPKLAFIVKTNRKARPIRQMTKIFKYAFNKHKLKRQSLRGVKVFSFDSSSQFGYHRYRKNTTSKKRDFSPSFAYYKGYLIVTFNKNTIKAMISYFKGAKGLAKTKEHSGLWTHVTKKYPIKYYIKPDRIKELATTYIKYLYNNEPGNFYHHDAKDRLTPLINLLEEVQAIGGGLKFLKDQAIGEILIQLK